MTFKAGGTDFVVHKAALYCTATIEKAARFTTKQNTNVEKSGII